MSQIARSEKGPRLRSALRASIASVRLQAVMAAGMWPDAEYIDVLVERCAVEPDFYVRDMLTWALTRHEVSATVTALLVELKSDTAQARSQALHTLSKIGDRRAWPAISPDLLRDNDDEVARAAWRTAVGLVPPGQELALAVKLATQFGRGDRDVRLSLSRAFVTLGDVALPVVKRAKAVGKPGVRAHAIATMRMMEDPEEGFDAAIAEGQRLVALLGAPLAQG